MDKKEKDKSLFLFLFKIFLCDIFFIGIFYTSFNFKEFCSHSLMDRTSVCGTDDPSSILGESTLLKNNSM